MTISTVANDSPTTASDSPRTNRLLTPLTLLAALLLLAVALYLRLHNLGLPYDRDGYDEGVYWQSVRSMSAGHALYGQVFYAQPPFFLLSVFPIFMLFGQTLWAARLGVALFSLTGFIGAFLLGHKLAGRIGALCAMLLLVIDPFFLTQSQTLQAEAPSAALSLLAIGLAYVWWDAPAGLSGILLAVLCAVSLMLSICCKLLGVATIVPIALIMGTQLWRVFRVPTTSDAIKQGTIRSIIFGIIAFILTALVLFLPFISAFSQLWADMVTLHTASALFYKAEQAQNIVMMHGILTSISAIAALVGIILALLRKDWRVLPLIAWLLVTIIMLWLQVPLFHHHLVALIPPLLSLVVINLDPSLWHKPWKISPLKLASLVGLVLVLVTIGINAAGVKSYYASQRMASNSDANKQVRAVAADVKAATRPDQLVITDAQFVAAVADRNTPPSLVDTSLVREATGYVTLQQLIQAAQLPQVHAVLFYSGRFNIKSLAPFRTWVAAHYHLAKDYGSNRQLWVKG
ncbi:MAG TPA: glycosyltransferase family 39 protein [Ktedonobacteraceae bacterium]|nr:glycosyltransferase family 39 protein [Ktedonobacteraceae bacterium]